MGSRVEGDAVGCTTREASGGRGCMGGGCGGEEAAGKRAAKSGEGEALT